MKHSDSVKVLISGCRKKFRPAIKYTFDELAVRLGIPIRLCEDSNQGPFHLVYGRLVKGIAAPSGTI